MDPDFWLKRWERNEIGFHEGEANHQLVAHFQALALPAGARVFVPLCGKTRDIAWLLAQGHRVVGAELSELAIRQLFAELGVAPEIAPAGALIRYSAAGIDIYGGNIFDLSRDQLGPVDAVYDRAALVALPPAMRDRYAAHVAAITDRAPQLLLCFEHDHPLTAGPPFSIDAAEVARLCDGSYRPRLLQREPLAGGVRGQPAIDAVWLLR